MERLKNMKETLMNCVQGQMGDLRSVDTKELGEAIDMIKDLSEAIYYCTVTEAMHSKEESMYSKDEKKHMYYPPRDMDRERGRMYYDGMMWEGRSPMTRKTYMEHKHQHLPKEMQIQELEKYMQELSHDITEMIEDSTSEEKQILAKKLTALANKIV